MNGIKITREDTTSQTPQQNFDLRLGRLKLGNLATTNLYMSLRSNFLKGY